MVSYNKRCRATCDDVRVGDWARWVIESVFLHSSDVLGIPKVFTTRHAQTPEDLGFTVQFNADLITNRIRKRR